LQGLRCGTSKPPVPEQRVINRLHAEKMKRRKDATEAKAERKRKRKTKHDKECKLARAEGKERPATPESSEEEEEASDAEDAAEPPKLSRLKCAGHHHKGNISSNARQTEQFWVCRVTSRYNHRSSDRTSIPRMKATPEILQPQFYNAGIVMITNQLKPLLQKPT